MEEAISLAWDSRLVCPDQPDTYLGHPRLRKGQKRALKACLCCRRRKVRCDVVRRGVPCTNCELDQVECATSSLKFGRENGSGLYDVTKYCRSYTESMMDEVKTFSRHAGPLEVCNDAQEYNINEHPPGFESKIFSGTSSDIPSRCEGISPDLSPVNLRPLLPPYLKGLGPHCSPDEIIYLSKKGALSIPVESARNALVQKYIEFVHQYLPVIELHEFLRILHQGDGSDGKISLILFHAVLFAGSSFVDDSIIEDMGFKTRREAREDFFQRARLLYDHNYESNHIALIQALLLMTYWAQSPTEPKGSPYWLGIALSLAQKIGLNNDSRLSHKPPLERKHARRIWWSCLMRDRLIALGLGRMPQIRNADFDVPMLTQDDFEIQSLCDSIDLDLAACVIIRDPELQRQLAELCIAKAKLCIHIGNILTTQYSPLITFREPTYSQQYHNDSGVTLFPKRLNQADIERCEMELRNWLQSLPESCIYHRTLPCDIPKGLSSMIIQRALLRMIYLATSSALHRQHSLRCASGELPGEKSRGQLISQQMVDEGSAEVALICQNLHELGLDRYLPPVGVAILLPALTVQVVNMKLANIKAQHDLLANFHHCMTVFRALHDIYVSTDNALTFLNAVIQKARLGLTADNILTCSELLFKNIGYGILLKQPCTLLHNTADLLHACEQVLSLPPSHLWEVAGDRANTVSLKSMAENSIRDSQLQINPDISTTLDAAIDGPFGDNSLIEPRLSPQDILNLDYFDLDGEQDIYGISAGTEPSKQVCEINLDDFFDFNASFLDTLGGG